MKEDAIGDAESVNDVLDNRLVGCGRLYDAGALARFVIDEVHCISTLEGDFRDAVGHSF